MKWSWVLGSVALSAMLIQSSSVLAVPQDRYTVLGVVALSRHGVRSPTKSNDELARYAMRLWPQWAVAPGELTAHGAALESLMGRYLRSHYASTGLLPQHGCPAPTEVRFWADNADQRTRESAKARLAGMFPNCPLAAAYAEPIEQEDPLFHSGTQCPLNAVQATAAINDEAVSAMAAGAPHYAERLAALQTILGKQADASGGIPFGIKVSPDGSEVKLSGPLSSAATVSEVFLLEYAEGFPLSQVGWGEVDRRQMADFLSLHDLQFELTARSPYLAARRGTLLAAAILDALRNTAAGKGPRLVSFIGHDTNLANLAGLLQIDWAIPEQPDKTGPGTTLAFELIGKRKSAEHFVRLRLYAQSLDQLRERRSLDARHPPMQVDLAIPGCQAQHGNLCTLDEFAALLSARLDQDCLVSQASRSN